MSARTLPVDLSCPGGPNLFGIERRVYDALAKAGRPLTGVELVQRVNGRVTESAIDHVMRWISDLRAALAYSGRQMVVTAGREDTRTFTLAPAAEVPDDAEAKAARRDVELLRLIGACQSAGRVAQALGFPDIASMNARVAELRAARAAARKASVHPDLPPAIQGRPDSRRRAVVNALRTAGGAFVSAADLAGLSCGQADHRTLESVRSMVNEARAGLRTTGYPAEIETRGLGDTLSYAWRAGALRTAQPAPATAPAEAEAEAGPRIRISLAGGVWFDGDRVVGADGTRWDRARA